ncbi:chorismate mutase [Geodermatophilus sp. SYSU D00700]
MTEPTSLADVRSAIDRLDEDLVALLARRERLVRAAARFKTDAAAVRAPGRVEQVVARARRLAAARGASPEVAERVYRAMIAAFVDLELSVAGVPDDGPDSAGT